MRIKFTGILWVLMGLGSAFAQQIPVNTFVAQFTYDDAGNRIKREVITINDDQLKTTDDTIPEPIVKEEDFINEGDITSEEDNTNEEESQQAVAIESVLDGAKVKIYPNPVTETLIVSIDMFSADYKAEISVYDMSGKLLQTQNNTSRYAPISFLDYGVGTYVLKITVNNEHKEWLIVKK